MLRSDIVMRTIEWEGGQPDQGSHMFGLRARYDHAEVAVVDLLVTRMVILLVMGLVLMGYLSYRSAHDESDVVAAHALAIAPLLSRVDSLSYAFAMSNEQAASHCLWPSDQEASPLSPRQTGRVTQARLSDHPTRRSDADCELDSMAMRALYVSDIEARNVETEHCYAAAFIRHPSASRESPKVPMHIPECVDGTVIEPTMQ